VIIDAVVAADKSDWRRLWDGYKAFYGTRLPESVTDHTWRRLLDPGMPMLGRIARCNGMVAGFSISILHEATWAFTPVCYLEDLYVDPHYRGLGIGRRMVQDLLDMARAEGWSRLYWHTHAGNPARALYDSFTPADDFVRYRLIIDN
jgi:GNAT superfamily N-acetyltransferase